MNCEWYTPPYIIEKAKLVLGTIDLDPASCEYANRTVGASKIYTAEWLDFPLLLENLQHY